MKIRGEPQTDNIVSRMRERGPEVMGVAAGYTWQDDPRRLIFMLSRYKFVAKMLAGCAHVLEVGCGDGFGTRVVAQTVGRVTAADFDVRYIESARAVANDLYPIAFVEHDFMDGPLAGDVDGIFALDVLEHIPEADEERFLGHCIAGLADRGTCIVGMPSIESQPHASAGARMGHVNCKTQPDLKAFMETFFHNVYMFSMNDEVLHTGFAKMAHYNIALCCGKRGRKPL
ncbi:MAG: class I SAM-dependent methyltransferase [Alphaproteobacteria bacterium]|nr:class I SAM-dependent methyltransferase [Alphaproteobacteria bacterium]MBF0130377.1 class I SAM-dependent methyltransferase [Alphaproteobacteria bacterium]